jgi:hypothetical protein
MKIEEIVILGLTGAAAYLYWKMRSQKTAVVTQSITAPVTRPPVSTAVVPEDSAPPSMPTMPKPVSSSLATPVVLQVGPNERCGDVLVQNGYDRSKRCLPKNLKLQLASCDSGKVREIFAITMDLAHCAADEVDNPWRGIGKCVSPEDNKLLSQTKPLTVPQGPIEPMVVVQDTKNFCIPMNQIVEVTPCPEGQTRTRTPCSKPGFYPRQALEDVRPDKVCPPGYKFNRAAIPCRVCPRGSF